MAPRPGLDWGSTGRLETVLVPTTVESLPLDDHNQRGIANVQIRLLGGVTAETSDGRPIDVGPAKSQTLLAALALSPGTAISVTRLVELVWGEDPPRTAEKTLQTYVGTLRQGLGNDTLVRAGAAYRLDVAPDAVDVFRFHEALSAGDIERALQTWTGEPLAGLDAPGLRGVIDGLTEQWLDTTERSLADTVEHDPAGAVARLTELTTTHPFREGLWALLMTALYQAGRQADALAAFSRARAHLVEELGVEPGPALRDLEASILDQALPIGRRDVATPHRPSGTVTFAFCDVEGSSALWSSDRQGMSVAASRYEELLRACTDAHDGSVFSTGGDSFGLAFHRANDAAAWAIDLQAELGREHWPAGITIRARIGLHTGEADERDGEYFGHVVNTAAQLASTGHGGQIVVSAVAAALLDPSDTTNAIDLVELGTYRLDGVPADMVISQVGTDDHPPLRTDQTRRGNLPLRMGRLHGRDDEVDLVVDAMHTHSLVTLVGPGGIGKTRVAIATAHLAAVDLPGGAWLVELADVSSSDDVALAVLDAIDGRRRDDRTTTEAIVAHLRGRATLLVLDNCEHVVDGTAAIATALSRSCPEIRILATSREGLAVPDERLLPIGPLDPAGAAVALFNERALAADAGFDAEAERPAAEEICQRLDGVPLAIEIAAARLRTLSTADLVSRLDDRLRLLTSGRRGSVERHRTLRATIQWSYELLTHQERIVLRRLSVFAGGFELDAAETVLADEHIPAEEIATVLSDLVDRSMVSVESGSFGRRYRLLETVRQFAAELLAADGGTQAMAGRHALAVRDEVTRLGVLLDSNHEVEGAARLAELWPNLRAAVDWATAASDHELLTAILRPVALQPFARRGLSEITDWIERLLDMLPIEDEETIGEALLWASLPYSMTLRRDRFRTLIERYGNPDNLYVQYARLVGVEDDDYSALRLAPDVIGALKEKGQHTPARLFEMFIGGALLGSGRVDEAEQHLLGAAEMFRATGPPSYLNWSLYMLGAAAAFRGDQEQMEQYWVEIESVPIPPRTNSPNETLAARKAFRQGRPGEAALILTRYIDELDEVDNMAGVAIVGLEYVNLMAGLGRLDDAAVILGHFDTTGLLHVEGHGFRVLIDDAVTAVASDSHASATQDEAAARKMDEHDAIEAMRFGLTALIDSVG